MDLAPRLLDTATPDDPRAVVLVLHGGADRQDSPGVSPTQLSVLRMIPTAKAVARAGRGALAVHRVLNTRRGWDTHTTPVDDVAWALEEVRERYGDRPVGLVGHSLGGRAALLAGGLDCVRSVVALNPWVYPTDGVPMPGRSVLVVHGMRDRIAPPGRAETVARRIAAHTGVGFIRIPDGKHAMLRHGRSFDSYAAQFSAASLLGRDGVEVSEPVAAVLAGEPWVTA